jgi:hypothetical protein
MGVTWRGKGKPRKEFKRQNTTFNDVGSPPIHSMEQVLTVSVISFVIS